MNLRDQVLYFGLPVLRRGLQRRLGVGERHVGRHALGVAFAGSVRRVADAVVGGVLDELERIEVDPVAVMPSGDGVGDVRLGARQGECLGLPQ